MSKNALDQHASGLLVDPDKPLDRVLGTSVVGIELTTELFRYSTDHFPGADKVMWNGKTFWRLVITDETCARQPCSPT